MNDLIPLEQDLMTNEEVGYVEIVPFGMVGSHISGVKPDKAGIWRKTLFIGGVLDGQERMMPADGRLHDEPVGLGEDDNGGFETHRYVPSVVAFEGKQTVCYVFLQRLKRASFLKIKCDEALKQIAEQKRLREQQRKGISQER